MMMGNLQRWLIIRLIQIVMMMLNLLKMKLQIFLASNGVGYGPKSLWEQWRDTTVDIEYDVTPPNGAWTEYVSEG
ncbi:hypothetical protein Tco_0470053, partial [Tanacetum coccineum]